MIIGCALPRSFYSNFLLTIYQAYYFIMFIEPHVADGSLVLDLVVNQPLFASIYFTGNR